MFTLYLSSSSLQRLSRLCDRLLQSFHLARFIGDAFGTLFHLVDGDTRNGTLDAGFEGACWWWPTELCYISSTILYRLLEFLLSSKRDNLCLADSISIYPDRLRGPVGKDDVGEFL